MENETLQKNKAKKTKKETSQKSKAQKIKRSLKYILLLIPIILGFIWFMKSNAMVH